MVASLWTGGAASSFTPIGEFDHSGISYEYVFVEGTVNDVLAYVLDAFVNSNDPAFLSGYVHTYVGRNGADGLTSPIGSLMAENAIVYVYEDAGGTIRLADGISDEAFLVRNGDTFTVASGRQGQEYLALDRRYTFVGVHPKGNPPAPLAPPTCTLASPSDVYQIVSPSDLAQIGNPCDASGTYEVTQDIDFAGVTHSPQAFSGVLRGPEGRAVLSNLAVTDGSGGLFSELGDGAVVENLTFRNVTVSATTTSPTGVLAKRASGNLTVANVLLDGVTVSSNDDAGGLVGRLEADGDGVARVSTVTVSGSSVSAENNYAGGLFASVTTPGGTGTYGDLSITDVVVDAGTSVASGAFSAGGVAGEVEATLTLDRIRAFPTAVTAGHFYAGGLVGLFDAASGRGRVTRSFVSTSDVSGNSYVGGWFGAVQGPLHVADALASTTTIGLSNQHAGGGVGSLSAPISLSDVTLRTQTIAGGNRGRGASIGYVGKTQGGNASGEGVVLNDSGMRILGGVTDGGDGYTDFAGADWLRFASPSETDALGATSHTDADLRALATYQAAGWDIQASTAPGCRTTWAIEDGVGYPYLQFDAAAPGYERDLDTCAEADAGPPTPDAPVPTGLVLSAANGAPLPAERRAHLPFDVRVTLVDDDGAPVENGDAPATVTLDVVGGEAGDLRFATREPATPVTATLAEGASSVLFEDVVFVGGGDDVTEVALRATATGGRADGLRGRGDGATFTPVALTVTPDADELPADGVSTARVTIRLADVDGSAVAGANVRVTTDLGTLHATADARDDGTSERSYVTDADGTVTATLRAAAVAGVATVTADCPGSCPATARVAFVGAIEDVAPVPGDGRGWVVFDAPTGVSEVEIEIAVEGDAPRVSTVPGGAPVALEDLANGVPTTVRVRAVFDPDRRGPWSAPTTLTPSDDAEVASSEPAFNVPDAPVALTPDPEGGTGTFTVTMTARNTSETALENVWLQALDVPAGVTIVAIDATQGVVERVRVDGRENWFWRDANLAPSDDASDDALETLTVTLRVEVN